MCGIAGIFGINIDIDSVTKMTKTLYHRGPDDTGVWSDVNAGIALGHRRLSILDLSAAGHQPMKSKSSRYVIAFNGEIYNHQELRKELDASESAQVWRGSSDTETLLAGIECWGLDSILKKSIGMFAFALWDREGKVLTLARDRMGEKPLYYGWQDKTFLFGSELKALCRHPSFDADIDRLVLARYLRYGYISAPYSIYRNIFKLMPGSYMRISMQQSPGTIPSPVQYWSLRQVAERGLSHPFSGSDDDAVLALEHKLMQSVKNQSIADVPLGAFLSGGIDSSTIVALMQAQSSRPVKTFTIGFSESHFNEADYAKSVSQYLGTDHYELYVSSKEAMEVIPKLATLYDEPFGDSSAIPTFLVSQLARQHVTVSLSGDGGDELFGGYSRYQRTQDIWYVIRHVPLAVRRLFSCGLNEVLRHSSDSLMTWKAKRLADYLVSESSTECYQKQISHDKAHQFLINDQKLIIDNDSFKSNELDNLFDTMMLIDSSNYLPDDILAKVDRAAMGVSLETRVPMLDHRVLEFAWSLPHHMKVRKRESKWILKKVLENHIPRTMIDRPKMGFGVPVGQWIRGPLRDWAEELLSEHRLTKEGFLNPQLVRKQWLRHIEGTSAGDDNIWQILMFQEWLSRESCATS